MNTEIPPGSLENPKIENLKLVIAVRHGEYEGRRLNEEGRKQVQNLAEKLRGIIPGEFKVEIVSSTADRALQSAEIIASLLGVTVATLRTLAYDEHKYGIRMREDLLRQINGSEVLIVVSHYEAPSGIINAFRQHHFQEWFEPMVSRKGNGLMIDLRTGEVVKDIMRHGV